MKFSLGYHIFALTCKLRITAYVVMFLVKPG
jgi:hypothetical protein